MAKKIALTGAGFAAEQANTLAGAGSQGLVAAGTNQATGLVIHGHFNAVLTTAASTGVTLGACFSPGDEVYVYNGGASTLTVYPNASDTIDNTTSASILTKKGARLVCAATASGNLAWLSHGST